MKHLSWCLIWAASLHAGDPLTGRWQLNFEKSPRATPEISKFERDGDFFVNTNGTVHSRFRFDGQPHAAPNAQFDTVVWRQTGPRKFEHETKKAGQTVYTVVTEVAADGQSRAYRHTRNLAGGKTAEIDGVQDRVGGPVDKAHPLIGHWRLRRVMEWNAESANVTFRSGTFQFTAPRDGHYHPVTTSTQADNVSLRRVDAFTVEVKTKKNGRHVATTVHHVDDNILTTTANGVVTGLWERVR